MPDPVRAPPIPFLQAVRVAVRSDKAIFFLGDGIYREFLGDGTYRDGPLSSPRLIEAIGKETGLLIPGETCLPTVAEHYQRYLEDCRESFLSCFRQILSKQEKQTEPRPAIHQMLAELEAPSLVVSATHDLLLERYLESQGREFFVVTHILRDLLPGEKTRVNGKVLVMHRGPQSKNEIVLADDLPDFYDKPVIYKLLGSPCFNIWQVTGSGFDLARLDTVVVTEDDHVTFVGLLRNEKTKIPTRFSLPLQRKSIVFLGYNLDTWHYRLVATVFKERTRRFETQAPYAVRRAKSPIEDLFWERLHARMIEVDPERFIRALQAE